MRTLICLPFALILFVTSCGSDSETKRADKDDIPSNPAEAVRKVIKESGLNDSDMKTVDHRELLDMLDNSMDGYQQVDHESANVGVMGLNLSTAKGTYEKGDCKVEVNIADTGGMGKALMGMAAWSSMELDREDKTGYERTGTWKGYKSYEKFNNNAQRAELAMLVADRFIVALNGSECDMDALKGIAGEIDLKKLEKLKDN